MNKYYFEINGVQHVISLTWGTLYKFQEKTSKSIEDLDNNLKLWFDFFKIALEEGYRKDKIDFKLKDEEIKELLDDIFFDLQGIVLTDFVPEVQKKIQGKTTIFKKIKSNSI